MAVIKYEISSHHRKTNLKRISPQFRCRFICLTLLRAMIRDPILENACKKANFCPSKRFPEGIKVFKRRLG